MIRIIKKYKNRRLYDMELSQYITQDTLHQYVLQGVAFKVEDSVTHKDITNTVLLQIIVDMSESPNAFLSPELLRQMIVLANHPLNQSIRKAMEQVFAQFSAFSETAAEPCDYQKSTEKWQEWLNQWKKIW